MTKFVTVKRNGKKQVVPLRKRGQAITRRATTRDLMKWPPERVGKLLRSAGFENDDVDPFEFNGSPKELSVNGTRLSDIDQVYVGEEAVSFYRKGNEAATVFYSDMQSLNPGGKARVGGGRK